jgi:peptidoglycan hydrolase-like protein with peptidoglycan-binding domain
MKKILIALPILILFSGGARAVQAGTADLEAQLHYAESLVADLKTQVNNLTNQVTPIDTTPWVPATTNLSICLIPTIDLSLGATGPAVQQLQEFLNQSADTQINTTGAGAPGQETEYFGPLTAAAVARFQSKYAASILTPLGLSQGTGYWGAGSRQQAQILCNNQLNANRNIPTSSSTTANAKIPDQRQPSDAPLEFSDLPADNVASFTKGLEQIIGDTGDKEFLAALEDLITTQVGKEKLAELEKTHSPREVADLVFVLPSVQAGINQLLADYLARQQNS